MIQLFSSLGLSDLLPVIPLARFRFQGYTELAAANANITVTLKHPCNLLLLIARIAGYSASDIARWRFNGDTAANYGAVAGEPTDAVATSTINTAGILLGETGQTVARSPQFTFVVKETAGRVAKARGFGGDGSEVVGTAITMIDHGGLWNNTTALLESVTLNGGAGGATLNTGSYVMVLGGRFPTA